MQGIVSGKQFNDNSWNRRNNRRKVFHEYPTGEFPLTGLLSMLDPDWCDNPNPSWFEKRWLDPETTVAAGSTVPFTAAGSETTLGAEVDFVAGETYRFHVADKTIFRENQVLLFEQLPITGGTFADLQIIVTSIVSGVQAVEGRVIASVDNVINTTSSITTGPVGAPVSIAGTANAEGSNSTGGIFIKPYEVSNYTQIFKQPFTVTGTALVTPTDFDGSGIYAELAQDNLTRHMIDMEKSFFHGQKSIDTVIDDGEEVPIRTMGGIDWFMSQYEAADSVYRGGTGAAALTANSDDDKRIIVSTAGSLAGADFFGKYSERLFRCTSNKGFEKLAICGNGVLAAINKYALANTETHKMYKAETAWGWNVMTVETPFGVVHFKSHPLFNRNSRKRYDCYVLDVHNLKYRPLRTRDTRKLKGQQAPGADKRKDVWETECTLEMRLPQSCMVFKNIQTLT